MKYRNYAILAFRALQILCISLAITGFIWASSDWLLMTVLVEAPVTPLSILLMLYGTLGTGLSEIAVRLLKRKTGFLPETKVEANG